MQNNIIEKKILAGAWNKAVDKVIAAAMSDYLHCKLWIYFTMTVMRVLVKCTGSSSVLNKTLQVSKTDHWAAYQHFVESFASFVCCFKHLKCLFWSSFSTFAYTDYMATSEFAFVLRFHLLEYQHAPDPFTHSFFYMYDMPLSM